MTVRELIHTLAGCDLNAEVQIHLRDEPTTILHDSQVYHLISVNENIVIIDADNTFVTPESERTW